MITQIKVSDSDVLHSFGPMRAQTRRLVSESSATDDGNPEEVNKGEDESVDKTSLAGTKIFNAMIAEDKINKYKSNLRRDGLIVKHRQFVEQEFESYLAFCSSPNKTVWANAVLCEF